MPNVYSAIGATAPPTDENAGHGQPTIMAQVEKDTIGALKHLRAVVGKHLDNGGALDDAYYVDQGAYRYLDTYEGLASKNAG